MTNIDITTAALLGIEPGLTVRLIGGTTELSAALAPLPDEVTVTSLGSESADVGLVAVTDENDLRERLFTELDGLIGASHVWVLTHGPHPDVETIRAEADLVAWHATSQETLPGNWSAVRIQKP